VPDGLVRRIPEDPANPYRLGRHIRHDPRSAGYPFAARPESEAPVVSRPAWARRVGVLDQGSLGSCTGNAGAGWVGTDTQDRAGVVRIGTKSEIRIGDPLPPVGPVDEAFAVELYSQATQVDPWPGAYPPEDTGSDGTSVAAVLKAWGLAAEYTHALGGLADVLAGLQAGVVLMGTNWYDSMFRPTAAGQLVISANSYVAGGHEYDADGELDVEQRRVWVTNSWSPGWGLAGRAWLSYDTLARLLAEDGDATILHATAVIDPPEPSPFVPSGCLPAIGRLLSGGRRRRGSHRASG
jgi:hypothetical protein